MLEKSALVPAAVLLKPVVLSASAWAPEAVLFVAGRVGGERLQPEAVLPLPVVLTKSAWNPEAVLLSPAVLELSA